MGILVLTAGTAMLVATALAVARTLPASRGPRLLLAAYVIGWVELVVVTLALSIFDGVTDKALLLTFAGVGGTVVVAAGTRSRPSVHWRTPLRDLRDVLSDRLLLLLLVAILAGLSYSVALTIATPQTDDDVIFDHLLRAALWRQDHGIGRPFCACATYINTYPPHGEIGSLFTMVLGRADRFVGLVQTAAYSATCVGVFGLGRRIGLARGEALFGGLLAGTLPIFALQASTAENDLVVASFLVAAAFFLVDSAPAALCVAGLSAALAVGTKVTALIGLPLLLTIAVVGRPRGRVRAVGSILLGAVVGGYWYAANAFQFGAWNYGFPNKPASGFADIGARLFRFGIEFVDVSGAVGRDIWLYPLAAVAFVAVAAAGSAAGGRRRLAPREAALLIGLGLTPLALRPLERVAIHGYAKFWLIAGRGDLARLDTGRDITRAVSNFSWYGPLGVMFLVAVPLLAQRAVRQGELSKVSTVFALSPWYWLIAVSVVLAYQEFAGRFFMFPMALAASVSGILRRHRVAASAVASIAVTTLVLVLLNDQKRPAGVPLLEPALTSIWTTPRWIAQARRPGGDDVTRYIDTHVDGHATVALGVTPHDAVYPFFGRSLARRVDLLGTGREPSKAEWGFIAPDSTSSLCPSDWRPVARLQSGWSVYRRSANGTC